MTKFAFTRYHLRIITKIYNIIVLFITIEKARIKWEKGQLVCNLIINLANSALLRSRKETFQPSSLDRIQFLAARHPRELDIRVWIEMFRNSLYRFLLYSAQYTYALTPVLTFYSRRASREKKNCGRRAVTTCSPPSSRLSTFIR